MKILYDTPKIHFYKRSSKTVCTLYALYHKYAKVNTPAGAI